MDLEILLEVGYKSYTLTMYDDGDPDCFIRNSDDELCGSGDGIEGAKLVVDQLILQGVRYESELVESKQFNKEAIE